MAHGLGSLDVDADLRSTRAICHVDLDAFYAQVEEKAHPRLHGMPIAVIQYNPFGDLKTYREDEDRVFNESNGSIIALSYGEARSRGVKRNMRGTEARQLCPSLQLVQVPTSNGKADLTSYRRNGAAVLAILSESDGGCEVICEKASIDESYLDVTDAARERLRRQEQPWGSMLPGGLDQAHIGAERGDAVDSHVAVTARDWYSRPASSWSAADALLAHASQIVAEKRAKVEAELGFTLSAGVAHSKLLAKLCSGLHKPNQQTVLPASSVADLLHDLPLSKLRGLGGQLGGKVQSDLCITTIGELARVPMQRLHTVFGEDTGRWLHDMSRGVDWDPVQPRLAPKSVGCGKSFTQHLQIKTLATAQHWLQNLAQEIHERLEEDAAENGRRATRLVLHTSSPTGHKSRGAQLPSHSADAVSRLACQLMASKAAGDPNTFPLTGLSLVASAFDSAASNTASLRTLFAVRSQVQQDRPSKQARARSSDSGAAVHVSNDSAGVREAGCVSTDAASLGECMPSGLRPATAAADAQGCENSIMPLGTAPTGATGEDQSADQPTDELKSSEAQCAMDLLYAGGVKSKCAPESEVPCVAMGHLLQGSSLEGETSNWADAKMRCCPVAVDTLTLAQMPSDIRSELYLKASSTHGRATQPLHKKRSRSPREQQKASAGRKTHGIATFFQPSGRKRS